jgi:methionyl-tRNA formyltransferase
MNKSDDLKIAFFGTPQFAVTILEELKSAGIIPTLIVTAPDKAQGRGLVVTPPPAKVWAEKNNRKYIQPANLEKDLTELSARSWDLFIVAAYGKIIPENILAMPKYKTLNIHPSLLPKHRGPSPVESSILSDDQDIGVSIMRLDEEIDHGPIIAQEKITKEKIGAWPVAAPILEDIMARFGGTLLAKTIPDWTAGKITEKEQNHAEATYCKKISKADGLVDLSADAYSNYLKICAYAGWPGTFFFKERNGKNIRVTIKRASYKDSQLIIETVTPEGKSEMPYLDFLRGIK